MRDVLRGSWSHVTATASGQTNTSVRYDMPVSHNPLSAYSADSVPRPDLANSPLLDQLIRDGKLYLSLKDAIRLALENNLDLAIARYNLPIANMDILRTQAGGSFRGVNAGVVQGTPGGGVGGFGTGAPGAGAGGTTGGAGGAGAGASGLVQSTLGAGRQLLRTILSIVGVGWRRAPDHAFGQPADLRCAVPAIEHRAGERHLLAGFSDRHQFYCRIQQQPPDHQQPVFQLVSGAEFDVPLFLSSSSCWRDLALAPICAF